MANYFTDNLDWQYYLTKGIDWAPLVKLVEGKFDDPEGPKNLGEAVDSYRDMLALVGEYVAEQIVPHVASIDKKGLHLKDGEVHEPEALVQIFRGIKDMGLHGLVIPRELGGMGAPNITYFIVGELLARADVSMMTHNSFHVAMAQAALIYSIDEGSTTFDPKSGKITKTRFSGLIDEIVQGEAWGSMDITEPNAGSDMAALSTRAEQDSKGQWTVTGQKIFITSGHAKYHYVIARSEPANDPNAQGLKGLSLFLVKAYETQADGTRKHFATIDRIEEKLGHHASATCSVIYENSPAELIGKRGEGFKGMLLLMNNARVGVGFEGIGICEAAYRLARDYAAQRKSMGKTIDKHELIADYLDEMRTDIEGMRALAVDAAYHEEMAQRLRTQEHWNTLNELDNKRRQHEIKRHARKSRRATPLLKYLAGERAVEMSRRSLQIHGGVGYTQEYGAEKLLRDSLVCPIYEGTSQIQSLMAMKDTLLAALKNPQRFVRQVAQARWRTLSARDPLERRAAKVRALSLAAVQHLLTRMAADKLRGVSRQPVREWSHAFRQSWDPKTDFAFAMLHAERLTKMLADTTICEVLWQQADKHSERRDILERYLDRCEPRCRAMLDEITTTGDRVLKLLHADQVSDVAGAREKTA